MPRATIAGLEEGTRRAQQATADRLDGALDVEPSELAYEEGGTVLEEKVGDRVRVVKRYENQALEVSYDESTLGDAYRVIRTMKRPKAFRIGFDEGRQPSVEDNLRSEPPIAADRVVFGRRWLSRGGSDS